MKRFVQRPSLLAWLAFLAIVVIAGVMLVLQGRGVSARPEPSWIETRAALFMRGWLTPSTYKGLKNPVSDTEENFVAAREHFADHCASCHANDGSGNTEMGRSLYPKAPDMRLPRTQNLSDGEIFYFIENGIRLTGMPGWSTGTPEGERASWQLVHFIRRLPKLTPEDLAGDGAVQSGVAAADRGRARRSRTSSRAAPRRRRTPVRRIRTQATDLR